MFTAAQLPDRMLLDGEKFDLYSNPLEPYWVRARRRRPTFLISETCKRGYVATWEIIDKLLVLRGVDGNIERRSFLFWKRVIRYSIKMLFPKVKSEGVVATWFTGKIRIPQGNMLFYVHNDYDSRFEREMVVSIEKGKVLKTVVLDYKEQRLEVENEAY